MHSDEPTRQEQAPIGGGQTPIGGAFRRSSTAGRTALAIGIGAVGMDLVSVVTGFLDDYERLVISAPALAALLWIGRFDAGTLGLTVRTRQGWGYWVRVTLWLGVGMGLLLGAYLLAFPEELERFRQLAGPVSVSDLWPMVKHACIMAPLVEEPPYRLVLCSTLLVAVPERWAVAVSGVIFAALHFLYGTPAPDNMVGGFILAWAYLASGSAVLPLGLHALGNLAAVLFKIVCYGQ